MIAEAQSIYNMAKDGDFFEIYQELSKMTDQTNYENLAIQEYCLHFIVSDLEEHGEANLYMYNGGKMSISDFEKLHSAVFKKLIVLLKENNIENTLVWQAFGRIPLRFEEELGLF